MGKKNKKEYGLDFSFKYLQKRNIRKEKQEEHNHPHQLAIARWLGSIHHLPIPIPIPIPILNANTIPSVARYRSTPSVIPKSKDKAALRHHSQLQEKTPPPPPRYTNRRILSPYPLSFFYHSQLCKTPITKTVLSTAAPAHQP